jgi:hypothetical protein
MESCHPAGNIIAHFLIVIGIGYGRKKIQSDKEDENGRDLSGEG